MSRQCAVTGKKAITGNRRSDSLRATRRRWNLNLQKVKLIDENGEPYTVKMTARALRAIKHSQEAK